MRTLTDLRITDLDVADPATVEAAAALLRAASAADSPWQRASTTNQVRGALAHGFDLEPPRCFLGWREGEAVAFGAVHTSEWDNHDLAWLVLVVHPAHRRAGAGTAMLQHLEAAAREAGRTKLGTDAWDGSPGQRFAERHGYTARSRAIQRRQLVGELDLDEVRALHREAGERAAGYELLRIAGPAPEELLAPLAEVASSINDAPIDDLELEDEAYEPQRMRDFEEAARLRDRALYRVVARRRDTGELAAHTVVVVERETPEAGHQLDTAVKPEHRGHRLGLLVKADMVLWLADAEPRLETVDTWNAESNSHMIAVNEQLGYRWLAREWQYQK